MSDEKPQAETELGSRLPEPQSDPGRLPPTSADEPPSIPRLPPSADPRSRTVRITVRSKPGSSDPVSHAPPRSAVGLIQTELGLTESPCPEISAPPPAIVSVEVPHPLHPEVQVQPIPARMLNEFVYCQRLFYYEFVEGVFLESADTQRGQAIHKRVDSGSGALPKAKRKSADSKTGTEGEQGALPSAEAPRPSSETAESQPEVIHSRSVQMGSDRLGVVAKMDLVETQMTPGDPATALEVRPVDYKAGAPKEQEDANTLWDTDKMQLGLQALILRDNGYVCTEGLIYYRATKQRVRLPITPELESWILDKIAQARRVIGGPIPAPLIHSPKCVRCSLAPVCLPDETRMLSGVRGQSSVAEGVAAASGTDSDSPPRTDDGSRSTDQEPLTAGKPRRLMAARDDSRALYLNSQGYRVGCKDEVLQV